MKTGAEVFTQTDSLVCQPTIDGAPTITQLEYNQAEDQICVITFDHNILVHQAADFSLVKQVILPYSLLNKTNLNDHVLLTVRRL